LALAKVETEVLLNFKEKFEIAESRCTELERKLRESNERAGERIDQLQRSLADAELEISAFRSTLDPTEVRVGAYASLNED
jgi:hypothetical protein